MRNLANEDGRSSTLLVIRTASPNLKIPKIDGGFLWVSATKQVISAKRTQLCSVCLFSKSVLSDFL